jgi:hypothetical protein
MSANPTGWLPTPKEVAAAKDDPISDEMYQFVQTTMLGQATVAETLFDDLLGPFIQRAQMARTVGFLSVAPHDYLRAEGRLEHLIRLAEGYQRLIAAVKDLRQIVGRQEGLPVSAGDRPGGAT